MTVNTLALFVIMCIQGGTVAGYPVQSTWHNSAMRTNTMIKAPQLSPQRYKRHLHHYCQSGSTSTESCKGVGEFLRKTAALLLLYPILLGGTLQVHGDDELARYAAEGNKVGVDTQCFFRKCAVETAKCANDPNCLKGLACLSRCKGGSMCSTGCFAKYGSKQLDEILSCSVERNDCVQVPGKETARGWAADIAGSLPAKPMSSFDIASLEGGWFKVMGLDSRYDCFDCQKNTFTKKDKNTLHMEAIFRIPRPTEPGYMQNKIEEELFVPPKLVEPSKRASVDGAGSITPHLQSKGEMFGLTFWENWYVLGESPPVASPGFQEDLVAHIASATQDSSAPEMKLIYYTGHTLQGSYKGAFLYSRSTEMSPHAIKTAMGVITKAGLNPADFCMIRNQCFTQTAGPNKQRPQSSGYVSGLDSAASKAPRGDGALEDSIILARAQESKPKYVGYDTPFWFLGQNFFRVTAAVAAELADWFQDPALLSEWLVKQQVRMVLQQPMEVSPFAELPDTTR